MSRQQRICATMPHHFAMAASDEAYRDRRRRIETFTSAARAAPRSRAITIPVVVHVLYRNAAENISDAQVHSQIDVLNEDFRYRNGDKASIPPPFHAAAGDPMIEFALAQSDPRGQPSTGITRTRTSAASFPYDGGETATKGLDALIKSEGSGAAAWPRDDYLNLWVCALEGGLLGYAQFPGGAAATDGVVICTTSFGRVGNVIEHYNLGRTCVHEVGHWLNLLHIWGDDGNGCQHSDNIPDTPNQGGPNMGVPAFPTISCNNGPDGDMFMNYMDYVDDVAMFMFTRGQIDRMNATLAGPRASLQVSNGLPPQTTGAVREQLRQQQRALLSNPDAPRQQIFDGVEWV